jgi:hypothetical protein
VRALFLVLLLANLLFFAWTRWVAPPAAAARDVTSAATVPLRPIRLQREAPGPGSAGEPGSAAAPGSVIAAASCVSVGPFAAEAQANAAADALRRLGFASRLRAGQDEVRVGYWVRVPDLATPADASNALAALQAAGLADAYVIGDETPETAVSIGVYADAAQAAAVAGRVERAGFEPETSDRLRTLDVFWLDIDRQANGSIPVLEDLGPPPAAGSLPLELRSCPSAPVAEPATAAPAVPAAGPAAG